MRHLLIGSLVIFVWLHPEDTSAQDKKTETLPARALERFGSSKFRQGSRILCLAYSPNGRILAAGGGDDPVRLWDVDEGKLLRSLPEAWVHTVAFSPGGSVLVTGSAFKPLRVWETATGKEIGKLEGHKSAIKAVAISPDGKFIASGDAEGNVILWEVFLTARIVTTFKGHSDEITALAFSPDSATLASGSADRSIRFWDVDNGKFLRNTDAGCMVQSLAFTEPKIAVSGGDDHLVRFWNVDSAKQTDAWKGHEGAVVSLNVLREKKDQKPLVLVSGGQDGTIRLWSLSDKAAPKIIRRSLGDSDALALTRNGDFLATGGINNTIRIFETATLKEVDFGPGHKAGIQSLALSRDGKMLASCGMMGDLIVWEPGTTKVRAAWNCPKGGETVMAFSPDNVTLATATSGDSIRLWNAADGAEKFQLPSPATDPTLSVTFAADGSSLIVGRRSGKVEVWDLKEKRIAREAKYDGPAYGVAVSENGKLLAASGSNKVTVWDMADLKEVKTFGTRDEGAPTTWPNVASLAFHPNGKIIALSCYDGIIRLMDVTTGKEFKACEGHTSVAYGIAFSRDGYLLASAGFDRTVRLWEAFSGHPVAVLKGHNGPGTAAAFARDGRSFYTGSADTTILRWDATGVGPTLPSAKLNPGEWNDTWNTLATEDTAKGHATVWKCVGGGDDRVGLIEKSLYLVDPKHVDQLFEDLKSEVYKTRESATAELERYGRWMEGRLQEAVKGKNTLEVQRRLERLLGKLNVPGSITLNQERLRTRRVMMILEQIGDAGAIRVLDKLAGGAAEPSLQEEAAFASTRLKRSKGS